MIVKSATPSRSAGPETAGPSTMTMVGITPEQAVRRLATRPQPLSAAMPCSMSVPLVEMTMTTGMRWSSAAAIPDSSWNPVASSSRAGSSSSSNSIQMTDRSGMPRSSSTRCRSSVWARPGTKRFRPKVSTAASRSVIAPHRTAPGGGADSAGARCRERTGLGVDSRLLLTLFGDHAAQCVERDVRGRARGRPTAPDRGDDATGEFGDVDPPECPGQPCRDCRRRHDRCARSRRLRARPAVGRRRSRLVDAARCRSRLPSGRAPSGAPTRSGGGAAARRRVRRWRPCRHRRGDADRRRGGTGPLRRAVRRPVRVRRSGGGSPRHSVPPP